MPIGKDLDFSVHLHVMSNLIDKLQNYERVCGADKIHDTRLHLSILVNWKKNLEFYSADDSTFKMLDWTKGYSGMIPKFEPDQKYIDAYFSRICTDAENWLVKGIKKGAK